MATGRRAIDNTMVIDLWSFLTPPLKVLLQQAYRPAGLTQADPNDGSMSLFPWYAELAFPMDPASDTTGILYLLPEDEQTDLLVACIGDAFEVFFGCLFGPDHADAIAALVARHWPRVYQMLVDGQGSAVQMHGSNKVQKSPSWRLRQRSSSRSIIEPRRAPPARRALPVRRVVPLTTLSSGRRPRRNAWMPHAAAPSMTTKPATPNRGYFPATPNMSTAKPSSTAMTAPIIRRRACKRGSVDRTAEANFRSSSSDRSICSSSRCSCSDNGTARPFPAIAADPVDRTPYAAGWLPR
jgi:hypothetical protein